ncbi:hypothetical protein ScPMuIL_008972 [Solemya velum]
MSYLLDNVQVVKVDPSKFCHNVKKFKADSKETQEQDSADHLTWNLDRKEKEIDKKRKGEFPAWKPKPKMQPKIVKPSQSTPSRIEKTSQNENFEFEIVPLDKSDSTFVNNKSYAKMLFAKENKLASPKTSLDLKKNNSKRSIETNAGSLKSDSRKLSNKKRKLSSVKERQSIEFIRNNNVAKTKMESDSSRGSDFSDSDDTDQILRMSEKCKRTDVTRVKVSEEDFSEGENSAGSADTDEIISLSRPKINKGIEMSEDPKKAAQILKIKTFKPEKPGKDNLGIEYSPNAPKKILSKPKLQEFRGTKLAFSDTDLEMPVVASPPDCKSITSTDQSKTISKELLPVVEPLFADTRNVTDLNKSVKDERFGTPWLKSREKNNKSECEKSDTAKLMQGKPKEPVLKNSHSAHTEKGLSADQKRLESVKQRQRENLTQKSIIQQALKSVDNITPKNKIVFDSDEDDTTGMVSEKIVVEDENNSDGESDVVSLASNISKEIAPKTRPALFGSESDEPSDSDDEEERFKIKPQFEGATGRELMKLQSRYGNDERFQLDERFKDGANEHDGENKHSEKMNTVEEEEKARSLKILADVVGHQAVATLSRKKDKKSTFKDITALRFDPTSESHSQFEIKPSADTREVAETTRSKTESEKRKVESVAEEDVAMPSVSREKFYEIKDSLTQAFKDMGKSPVEDKFSLSATFGQQQDSESSDDSEEKVPQTLPTAVSGKFPWQHQSSDEASDMEETMMEGQMVGQCRDGSVTKRSPKIPVTKRRQTFFFFDDDDDRLKEGAQFYRKQSLDEIREKWLEKRSHLVEAYKSKHKKLVRKKRQFAAGAKYKRFTNR